MNHAVTVCLSIVLLVGCVTAPSDPYEAALYENDRRSIHCGAFGGVQCQERVSAERQQIVAEEMARRQREETRLQTETMRDALRGSAAPAAAPAAPVTQWCTVIVNGNTALDGCYPDRQTCNQAWGDIRAAGKVATDCVERMSAPPATQASPVVAPTVSPGVTSVAGSGQWCTTVPVVGGTAASSCYANKPECDSARDFHRQSGTEASDCASK